MCSRWVLLECECFSEKFQVDFNLGLVFFHCRQLASLNSKQLWYCAIGPLTGHMVFLAV